MSRLKVLHVLMLFQRPALAQQTCRALPLPPFIGECKYCNSMLPNKNVGMQGKEAAPSNTQLAHALLKPSLLGTQSNQEHLRLFLLHPLHSDFPAVLSGTEWGHIPFWEVAVSSGDICAPRKHESQLLSLWQRLRGQPAAGHRQPWRHVCLVQLPFLLRSSSTGGSQGQ